VFDRSRRPIRFVHRHVAQSPRVTLFNERASLVISSEMIANGQSASTDENDPRPGERRFAGQALPNPRTSHANDRRIGSLSHATERSRLAVRYAVDSYTGDVVQAHVKGLPPKVGQGAFRSMPSRRGIRPHKFMVYPYVVDRFA